ncbi:MAG TPA: hypothetical protein VHT05_15380 [Candidatus Elarobacter sp.]|nr:hypothetical protein [Candidatus Elarobacter sp.]
MSDLNDALGRAREQAQALHKQIESTTSADHAAIRADVKNAAESAQKLATSLRSVVEGQRTDAAQHGKDAAAALEAAAKSARDVGGATEAQLKAANRAMLGNVRDALQHLSQSVASQREKTAKT